MFDYFSQSIAVRNIEKFINQGLISTYPKYLTNKNAGQGFAEMIDILLEKKRED